MWLPRDQLPAALCPPRQIRQMTVISIAEVDPQGMAHWNIPLVRILALRADSIVVRLIDFPEGRLAWTESGS